MSVVSPEDLAKDLGEHLLYQEDPFELRGGGSSNWYFDGRAALSLGLNLQRASQLLLKRAQEQELDFKVVAGMGVGGRPLASGLGLEGDYSIVWASDDPADKHPINGSGLHGAAVKGKKVLAVDDIGTSGDSLETLIKMIRDEEGQVSEAIVVVDRSEGRVKARLGAIGVKFFRLFELNETTGLMEPTNA